MAHKEFTKKKPKEEDMTLHQEPRKEEPLNEGQIYNKEETAKIGKALPLLVSGDEKITILRHGIYTKALNDKASPVAGVELSAVNVSDTIIGSALFEAVFYDEEGNTLDTVEHKVLELEPNISYPFRITSLIPASANIRGYQVRILKTTMTPEPTATGNERVIIMKHELIEPVFDGLKDFPIEPAHVKIAIRNVSESTVATAAFDALFYDIEGNVVDTVKHKEVDLKSGCSRSVLVRSSIIEEGKVKSYDVKITRVTTADIEKVQFCWQGFKVTRTGEGEIEGRVKNVSDVKTDAAIAATFYNPDRESIGTRVIVLKDIESGTTRGFKSTFKPQEDDEIRTCTLHIGDIEEG